MKGGVGFSKKKGTIAGALRAFSGRNWDHTFVIVSMKPDIVVMEASRDFVARGLITRYDSTHYTTTFFFPDGHVLMDIERAVRGVAAYPEGDATKDGMADLLLTYMQALEPNDHWDFRRPANTSVDDIFNLMLSHEAFHKIVST